MFGKSSLEIHKLILRSTEVDLFAYVGSDSAAICRSKCYNRLLRYKRALDKVAEFEKEIKQDFTNDGPFRVKRLAKEPGHTPEAKKSLSFGGAIVNNRSQLSVTFDQSFGVSFFVSPSPPPVVTFGAVSPIAPVALLSSRRFLVPNGLLHNASGGVTSGFPDRVLTSTPKSKQVEFQNPETPITEIIKEAKVHLTVTYPSKTFHKELRGDFAVLGKAIIIINGSPQRIARAVLKNIALRKIVVERVLKLMNTQLNDICSRKRPSILRANTKDEIANFDFKKACLEWKERAPIFYAFLMTCAGVQKEKVFERLPSVAVSR